MLAHAEIIVRAPDGDLAAYPVIESPRKTTAAPLEIGKDAVAPFRAQRVEALLEKTFVVHHRHARPISASRWGPHINLLSVIPED